MTQLELAKKGIISPQMEKVAESEGLDAEFIRRGVADGTIVITANINHKSLIPCGIGKGLKTKVNANIGNSSDYGNVETELEKLAVVIETGADAVMDLSTGGNVNEIRRAIVDKSTIAIGTVPIYQAGLEAARKHGAIVNMTDDELFDTIAEHA